MSAYIAFETILDFVQKQRRTISLFYFLIMYVFSTNKINIKYSTFLKLVQNMCVHLFEYKKMKHF